MLSEQVEEVASPELTVKTQRPSIDVKGVRVAYRSYQERPTSLKETLLRFLRSGKLSYYSTFDALADVTFQVHPGEVVAVIGSNGSGKSTLLKVLSGVLTPTEGNVRVRGRKSSLIELGAGFDPELNAVENIFLNGSLHGRKRKELQARVQPILEFAELTEFATTPVKYYSSGMYARLGFSVAVDINPDVLLVDEILAVGDERFRAKCDGVMRSFLESNKTIIIVSHDLEMLQSLAHRVLLFSKGRLVFDGSPDEGIAMYRDSSYEARLG